MRSRACCCFSHPAALITGSVLLALVLAMPAGCQGLPAYVDGAAVAQSSWLSINPPHHWIDRLPGSAREENKPTRMICTGLL